MHLEDLRREMRSTHEAAKAILEAADAAGREMTNDETARFAALQQKFNILKDELETESELGQTQGRKTESLPVGNPGGSTALFKDLSTGQMVNGYKGTAPINPRNDAPLGDTLRAILLNDFSELPGNLRNAMTTGSDSSGGYLLETALSSRVIDLARANSVVMRAGAMTVPMAGAEMAIARVTGDPTGYWRAETGSVTASTPTFGRYYLRPKTLAAIVPVSMELLEDTPNGGQLIEQTLMNALGVEMDRVLLEGTGATNEPLGVVNTSGVNSQTSVGTPSTYSQITTAIGSILSSNYPGMVDGLSWIMNPTVAATYDGLVTGISSDNTPLEPTPWVRQLQRYYTTNLAASGSPEAFNMVVGDFSQLLVGMRTSGVVIDVVDAGSVTDADSVTWNATSQFLRHVRARLRVDCVVMQPGFFSVLSGVNA